MGLTRSPSVLNLTIASGNPQKVAEIEEMLGPLPLNVLRQPAELDVEETGTTYLENALLKASAAAQLTGNWALADDSGLEVDALNGAPGLYTARLAPTDNEKISKLLRSMAEQPYRSVLGRTPPTPCLFRWWIGVTVLAARNTMQLRRNDSSPTQSTGKPRKSSKRHGSSPTSAARDSLTPTLILCKDQRTNPST